MPLLRSFAISELVQAQRCPVVRLGHVHVNWLDKASFGPGCKPGSHKVVFVSQCPLMVSLGGRIGVSSGGSKTPGVVEGDALYEALRCFIRVVGSTPQPQQQRIACAATAPYHRLCT